MRLMTSFGARAAIAAAALLLAAPRTDASSITFNGYLNDNTNPALIGWGPGLPAPSFVDDSEIANNVALYGFTVATPGTVTFTSHGFAAGGVDPYFTLFSGATPAATFVASNYDQAFSTGGDFVLDVPLAAGDYQLAIGAFANMSFAENLGVGTLDDGFIGLGYLLGSSWYDVEVTLPESSTPVPEPATLLMTTIGLGALAGRRKRRMADRPGTLVGTSSTNRR